MLPLLLLLLLPWCCSVVTSLRPVVVMVTISLLDSASSRFGFIQVFSSGVLYTCMFVASVFVRLVVALLPSIFLKTQFKGINDILNFLHGFTISLPICKNLL